VVTNPLAGVTGRRDKTCVGGKPVGTLESGDVAHSDQELGPEDRPHARQANENPSLGTGEKTLSELLIDALDALFEGEHLCGELRDDAGGHLLCGQANALGSGRAKCLMRYVGRPFDAAGPQVSSDALVARSSKVRGSLVVSEEDKGTFAVQIQRSLQCRKQR
jgi:hypothetical protein